ncbi:hypothetical protein JY651_40420 [Pyxidicoccus parkwayensis]|uniref:Uncharacterized protein n=1 Tax=Pyxidicoccus parkwayensis TaxID=2813578 RepID=A0ABX7NR92_9BACT|nr:hypothetical protein [Pyxidicoccus parkwaysis]QSQ21390.1 hypothetical protein JY651_40420 [Pyxidicoccus parkwaysis]
MPGDEGARLARALVSLDGLSVGDAFGCGTSGSAGHTFIPAKWLAAREPLRRRV